MEWTAEKSGDPEPVQQWNREPFELFPYKSPRGRIVQGGQAVSDPRRDHRGEK